jgi:Tol biopolymer transport system component
VPDPQRGETAHNWPEALPGGAGVLFTVLHGPDLANARIAVWSADAGDWSILLDEEGYNARYASGHLIYGRAGVVWAVPFDAERLAVTGNPVQVLDDAVVTGGQGAQDFTVSSNGTLAFVPYVPVDTELVWMDREGTFIEPLGAPVRPYKDPDLSPDGERIVVDVDGRAFIYNIENGNLAVLPGTDRNSATAQGGGIRPSWSPDGSRITFIVGGSRLYTAPADGSGGADLVWESPFQIWGPQWSPDGEFIVGDTLAESGFDVWRVSLDDGQPAAYLQGSDNKQWPAFSPSGSWLAYASSESAPPGIYARPFPDSAGRRVEIAGDATEPLWFDGELIYHDGLRVFSVRIEETATDLRILDREQLPVDIPEGGWYDYDPVNGRFLVARLVIENPGPRIHVAVNWFAEISARLGARR